jgi:GTPase SAR1 family protein
MPEVEASPVAPSEPAVAGVRVVLFGMPHAGKSSLLGAFLQAAQTQEHLLNGRLTDLSHGLSELRRRLYEEPPHATTQEVVPYPIIFEQFANPGQSEARGALEAVLVDCDGRVANDLLTRRRSLTTETRDSSLANSILDADTLILAVDASDTPAQVDADFDEFGRFLSLLERSRGRRTDLSGLPVFLVLTKCDLAARPADTPGSWIEQIEERKSQVATRFDRFLRSNPTTARTPFGRIDLHIWATAIKRPALAGTPEKPREPYGVAELFRQALASARTFHKHRRRSNRRLVWTVAGVAGSLFILIAVGLSLAWTRANALPGVLGSRVERFRAQQQAQTPAEAHRNASSKIDELRAFSTAPAFSRLPQSQQEYIRAQFQELEAYRDYERKLAEITDPANAVHLKQLDEIENALRRLQVPDEYRTAWAQTDAGRRQADWLDDVEAIRSEVDKVVGWYQKLINEGQQVLNDLNGANLPERARKVLEQARAAPFPEQEKERLLPRSRRVSYATVFSFTNVSEVRNKWEEMKKKLEPYARFDKP